MTPEQTGSGRGKLLLFGEHAAVYGHPACGLTLDLSIRLRIAPTRSQQWHLPDLDAETQRTLHAFLENAALLFPKELFHPGEITVDSSIPIGMGFGSSAAWCTAFTRAILGPRAARETVWELAHRSEQFFHGTPSGIDTGLAILDGLYAFFPSPPHLPEAKRLSGFPMHFLVGAAPREGSTRGLVGNLKKRIESNDREAVRTVDKLGELSGEAIQLLEKGDAPDIERLGHLANEAQRLLARLGLSTATLDAIMDLGQRNGALGGKLSGAGGGGAFYLLFGTPETADRAYRETREALLDRLERDELVLFRYSR